MTNYLSWLCCHFSCQGPPAMALFPKTPTREDSVWILNLEGRIEERRGVCSYLYTCALRGQWEKSWKGGVSERLGNPFFEHFVLCASFVYWVPTLAAGLQCFSQIRISITGLVVSELRAHVCAVWMRQPNFNEILCVCVCFNRVWPFTQTYFFWRFL